MSDAPINTSERNNAMAFEARDLSGSLFRNEEKNSEHPNWPDYKGKCVIEGKSYWINAWVKKDKNEKSFMSIAFKPVDDTRSSRPAPEAPKHNADNLPF